MADHTRESAGRGGARAVHEIGNDRAAVRDGYLVMGFGVGSGMPLRIAARKAPDAVILPVDAEAYTAASEQVMATLRAQPGATVQVVGWDEAFIGVHTEDPERYARQVQQAVLKRTRLHCSVGIGDTLVRAKVATGSWMTRRGWLAATAGRRRSSAT